MSNDYCENELIQKTAAEFFHQQLGWETYYAFNNEVIGETNSTFGRKSYKEVLLPRRLHAALTKLNPWITADQINEVKKKLEEHLASASACSRRTWLGSLIFLIHLPMIFWLFRNLKCRAQRTCAGRI